MTNLLLSKAVGKNKSSFQINLTTSIITIISTITRSFSYFGIKKSTAANNPCNSFEICSENTPKTSKSAAWSLLVLNIAITPITLSPYVRGYPAKECNLSILAHSRYLILIIDNIICSCRLPVITIFPILFELADTFENSPSIFSFFIQKPNPCKFCTKMFHQTFYNKLELIIRVLNLLAN
jgi:hypothetical protein